MNIFELIDGRLYQWDTDRKIKVLPQEGKKINEVHFAHEFETDALPVEVDAEGAAKIPDILLQSDEALCVWAVAHADDGRQTLHNAVVTIRGRAKPEDYVYTEDEIKSYEKLEKRIEALEENGGGGGAVESVNGQTGAVTLTASDIGAIPAEKTGTIKSTGVLIAGDGQPHYARMEGGAGRTMFSMRDAAGNIINRVSLRESETTLGQPLAVSSGGHGGKTAAEGRDNLEVYSKAEIAEMLLKYLPTTGGAATGPIIAPRYESTLTDANGRLVDIYYYPTSYGNLYMALRHDGVVVNAMTLTPDYTRFDVPVEVNSGGTGVKTIAAMREKFSLYSKQEVDDKIEDIEGDVNRLTEEIERQKEAIESLTQSESTILTNDDFIPGFWTNTGLKTDGSFGLLKTHQHGLPTDAKYTLHVSTSDMSNLTITATKYNASGVYSGYEPQNVTIENGEYVLPSTDASFIKIAVAKYVNNVYMDLPSDLLIWVTSENSKKVEYKLFDSICKPIKFTGVMLAYGDSITAGVTSPDLAVTENSYIKLLAAHTGMTLTNRAMSGTYITDADDTPNSIYKRITSWTDAADVIIIAGGTNDYAFGKPLGAFGSTDAKTFYGALRGICEHLKANYPENTVIFVTPIPHTRERDAAILPIDAYRNAIYEVATSYEYNVVDGSTLGMPDRTGDWENTMIADGDNCHPTEAGHKLYFRGLCRKLL